MKYALVACALVDAARDDLPAWLSFHRTAGVEHIYLYMQEPLNQAVRQQILSLVPNFCSFVIWPRPLAEYAAWAHACCISRGRADWLLCLRTTDYLAGLNGLALTEIVAGYDAGVGLIDLRPFWQISLDALTDLVAPDLDYLRGRVDVNSAHGSGDSEWLLPTLKLMRPHAVTDELELASGWAHHKPADQSPSSNQAFAAANQLFCQRLPMGLTGAVAAEVIKAANRKPNDLARLSPGLDRVLESVAATEERIPVLEVFSAPSRSLASPDADALLYALRSLADGRPVRRILLFGDMPLLFVLAMVELGHVCDILEAVPARAAILRKALEGWSSVRLISGTLNAALLQEDYDLVAVWGGESFRCNRLDSDAGLQALLRLAQSRLAPDGLLLILGEGRGVSAELPSVSATYRVAPGWEQPSIVVMDQACSRLTAELSLVGSSAGGQVGGVIQVHGSLSPLAESRLAWMAVAGGDVGWRRVHEYVQGPGESASKRKLYFGADMDEVQRQLGADIEPDPTTEAIAEPRCLELMRVSDRSGEMDQFTGLLRAWADFLRGAVDGNGMLPGRWFDALPAHVRVLDHGEMIFMGGEWRYCQEVDIRLVLYLGLWQVAGDPGLARLLPKADRSLVVRWLAALIDLAMDEVWLRMTEHIQCLTGIMRTPPPPPTLKIESTYTQQLDGLKLSEAVVNQVCRGWQGGNQGPQLAIIVVGVDAELRRASLASLAELQGAFLVEQVVLDEVQWIPAFNDWLSQTQVESSMVLEAGDQLDPAAALIICERLAKCGHFLACYADEDSLLVGERREPIFKPDFNLDLLRAYPYIGRGVVFRSSTLRELGGLSPGLGDAAPFERLFELIERHGPVSVGHVGEVLYSARTSFGDWLKQPDLVRQWGLLVTAHLDRLGIAHQRAQGSLPGSVRVSYQMTSQPLVSIIVLAGDQLDVLACLLDSLLAKTAYTHYELLIVDQASQDPAIRRYLDGLAAMPSQQIRVVHGDIPDNPAACRNQAAQEARGEYLLWLAADIAVFQPQWLEVMIQHALRPEVGVVGAKLLQPDGKIQQGGLLLGLEQCLGRAFHGLPAGASGYMQRLQFDQNYSAVGGACMMVRKTIHAALDGFDGAELGIHLHDVDLCLRVQQAGYTVVWTPGAQLVQHGSKWEVPSGSELAVIYQRWMLYLAADPAYNRNLTLEQGGFKLDPYRHIAWQPFVEKPLPRVVCHPADRTGCGHYRVRQPFLAMQREAIVDGAITEALLSPVTLARFEADTIILQRQHTDPQREALRRYLRFSDAFKVYELDDYMFNLPMKSVHRGAMPKDLRRQLRQAVAMTDRFVVSTQVLAEQFADMHDDIRVMMNRLPTDWWSGLAPARRVGTKPRVGWGGGSSHTGDLELIADVVRELADEVDWVFFGMCPEKLKPYVREFHVGVPIEQYPAKLASLNLDLAVAPLEDNLFNHCKSNLRLLEYGACGFPVVCSDLITYRGDLPVTRVKNRFKDWVAAIRMHLSDLDATAAMGDALRDAVMRDWTLTGQNLVEWRDVWLPD